MPTVRKPTAGVSRRVVNTALAGTFLLAAGAFVLSFASLSNLAQMAGIDHHLAWIWPLIVDGLIVVSTVAIVALAEHGRRALVYPWFLLIASSLVWTVANSVHAILVANGAVPEVVSAMIAAVPPLVLLAVTHLSVDLVQRSAQPVKRAPRAARKDPEPSAQTVTSCLPTRPRRRRRARWVPRREPPNRHAAHESDERGPHGASAPGGPAMTSAVEKLVAITLREAKVGRRWLVVLEQGLVWVPRDAFGAWEQQEAFAAWGKAPGSCTPVEDVPGAILVADMDLAYRRNVEAFLWRKSKRIAESQATAEAEMELAGMGENVLDGAAAQDAVWMQRATDDNARRTWFESLPLVRALRAPEMPAPKKKHKGGKRKHASANG